MYYWRVSTYDDFLIDLRISDVGDHRSPLIMRSLSTEAVEFLQLS